MSLNQVDSIVEGFLKYLEDNQVLELLPEIADQLSTQSFVRIDPNLAIVSSKINLSSDQQKNLKLKLSKSFNRPIRLKTKIDSSIIAGLKIEIDGQVIDATINQKLAKLKDQVTYD